MAPKIQWPLVLFSMLVGCGGCCFSFAGLANMLGETVDVTFIATIVSFVFVIIGSICSVLHLATPRHAFAAVTHILSFSGISVEFIMLGVLSVFIVAYGACCLWFDVAVVRLVLGLLGAVAGVVLAFVTGHGYLISSKPTWNTKKLPLAYTGTALVAGGFLYALVSAFAGGIYAQELPMKVVLVFCALLSVVTLAVYIGHLGKEKAETNVNLFRVGIVACGYIATPVCAVVLALCPSGVAFGVVAALGLAASLAGGLSLRMLMWLVGAGFLFFFEDARANRSAILNCSPAQSLSGSAE